MAPRVKNEYMKLGSDAARREWLAQYVLDPSLAKCSGFNRVTAFSTSSPDAMGQWLHESQIASSAYLNDPAAAKLLCASGDLREQRPSEWPAEAAEGVTQDSFTTTVTTTSAGTKEENGVDAETELKEQELHTVRMHIQSNIDSFHALALIFIELPPLRARPL